MHSLAAALVLFASLLAIPAGPVSAERIEDAEAARRRGDYSAMVRIIKPLAEEGDVLAQYNLGLLYYQGEGVPQDLAEAARWYRRAADRGDALSQYNLGLMFSLGEGVPQDDVLAHMWLTIAASRFPASDAEERKMCEENREKIASRMTPAQIAEAQRQAREWKPMTVR
jgi:TPR repeat protein